MQQLTLNVSDELAAELATCDAAEMSRLLELAMRERNARHHIRLPGLAEIFERLAELPSPEEVLALRPADSLQRRIEQLLEKRRNQAMTDQDEAEWQAFEFVEHLVRLAKARALAKSQAV
ncbi:MAG: hypothetical protein KY476_23175 [Planctomycetes bacterium]|nr:hypothetical protein [Planctomycetota bacterium]